MTEKTKPWQKKPWSQQTTEERLDIVIRHYQRALARIDYDGTALTHDTYLNDEARYSTAQDYQEFLQALYNIKDKNDTTN